VFSQRIPLTKKSGPRVRSHTGLGPGIFQNTKIETRMAAGRAELTNNVGSGRTKIVKEYGRLLISSPPPAERDPAAWRTRVMCFQYRKTCARQISFHGSSLSRSKQNADVHAGRRLSRERPRRGGLEIDGENAHLCYTPAAWTSAFCLLLERSCP